MTIYPLRSLRLYSYDILDLYASKGRTLIDLAGDFYKQYLERKTTCGYIWQSFLIDILNECMDEGLSGDEIEDTLMSAETLVQEIEAASVWHAWKGEITHIEIPDARRLFIFRKLHLKNHVSPLRNLHP